MMMMMIYTVSGGTLNPTHSLLLSVSFCIILHYRSYLFVHL